MFSQQLFLYLVCVFSLFQYSEQGIGKCIDAVSAIGARGDGSTANSCINCDPAQDICAAGCQKLVKGLYFDCDNVCLPDGYYFDPESTLSGCWRGDVRAEIKIGVERCGCDAAASLPFASSISFVVLSLLAVGVLLL